MTLATYSASYSAKLVACFKRHGYHLDHSHLADANIPELEMPQSPFGENILHGKRIYDTLPVFVKVVDPQGNELKVLRMVSSEPLASDPRNRCIRLLDSFPADEGMGPEYVSFAVFLAHRDWYDPPVHLVAEVIPFIHQLLEGLAFLHENNIAHGDIKGTNVLKMSSPVVASRSATLIDSDTPSQKRRGIDRATALTRTTNPTEYCYIDFGDCTVFDTFEARRRIQVFGGTFRLPENPYIFPHKHIDVFKADIWLLGKMLYTFFGTQIRIPTIDPLIRSMYSSEPDLRPTAQECLDQFRDAVPKMSWSLLLRLPDARLVTHYGSDVKKWPDRRPKNTTAYLERLLQLLASSRGKPRVLL